MRKNIHIKKTKNSTIFSKLSQDKLEALVKLSFSSYEEIEMYINYLKKINSNSLSNTYKSNTNTTLNFIQDRF